MVGDPTGPGRRVGPALSCVGLLLLTVLLAGCSPSNTASTTTAPFDAVSARPDPTVPSDRSGSLSQASLPKPRSLGPRWEYRVDNGSTEDGYQGNGTPAMARDVDEVVAAITPLGCRPLVLPTPEAALEVTYGRDDGTPAVGLVLEFSSPEVAVSFFQRRAQVMRTCQESRSSRATVTVLRDSPDTFIAERDEHLGATPLWTEGVRRVDARVFFFAVAGDQGLDAIESALAVSQG